jgi:type II secretory pathway component PulF
MWNDDRSDVAPFPKRQNMGSSRRRLAAHGIAWGLFFVLLGFGVPRIEAVFTESNMPLPRFTSLVIHTSHLAIVFALLVVDLLVVDWYVLDALSEQGEVSSARAWSALMLATPLLVTGLTLWALALPWFTIDWGLSG